MFFFSYTQFYLYHTDDMYYSSHRWLISDYWMDVQKVVLYYFISQSNIRITMDLDRNIRVTKH